jgi:hypothetical protein
MVQLQRLARSRLCIYIYSNCCCYYYYYYKVFFRHRDLHKHDLICVFIAAENYRKYNLLIFNEDEKLAKFIDD